MDNFEYSIQLNDRDWAEFFLASEECNLAPATLATAEEPCLSDIDQGDGVLGRDCHASTNGQIPARVGNGPGPGTGSSAPRGAPGGASPLWPSGGHLALPELLSGSEDEAELGSVSRFLCKSNKPGCPSPTPMPSTQGRQPPCSPAAALGSAAGGTGEDTACEAAAAQPASALEKEAASGSRAMEHPSHPAGASSPEQGGDAGRAQLLGGPVVAQKAAPVRGSSASPETSARKSPSSVSHSEPGLQGPLSDHPSSPSLETTPGAPGRPAQEETSVERAGAGPNSPDVRPKVPGQPRKSRKQRGASAAEVAQGEKEPVAAAAQGAVVPMKAPLSSPLPSRKAKAKEKTAKPAPVKLGSEEAGEGKRLVPSPGTDKGNPVTSAPAKQKVKEPAAQPLEKERTTKHSKPEQAGGLGVRENVPVIPASGAASPLGEACQEVPEKPPYPKCVAAFGGDAAEGAHEDPAAETPGELGPPCFAAGASARADTLDVTWPEMYDYLFCDSQGEEEGMENSVEGQRTPLEREISLPELYDYFFCEPEGKRKKVKGKDRKRKKFGSLDDAQLQTEDRDSAPVKDSLVISVPEVYEHFFPDGPRNRAGWRGIFSITPASEVKKAMGALKSLLQRPMRFVRGQAPAPQALLRRGSGEKLALVPLAPLGRGQAQPGVDMALALTGRPEAPLTLTHKDMCLVFCAFASWAVKTSDLQAPDAWKT
ncbi:PERM1 protein, partial [Centropus unirufus]|nr:PERM1 protein [Centropus unirufus]